MIIIMKPETSRMKTKVNGDGFLPKLSLGSPKLLTHKLVVGIVSS